MIDTTLVIREEAAADRAAIHALHSEAFGRPTQAALVERLHAEGAVVVSLVALLGERLVGHILFSRLLAEVARDETISAAVLEPLAVHPDFQGRGIAGALARQGLALCRARGVVLVVVLGDPAFYGRFGFSSELARNLEAPFSGADFMAQELVPGGLKGHTARLRYPAAFASELS